MSTHPLHIDQDPAADIYNPDHLKVGTLSYTGASLITLFLFLLWGDFCFTLMETVVPGILPLKLNAIGAPNWALGLIVTTIPNILNAVINPIASFRSDRFRSKWGRRIPFLVGATPFLVIFLILLGYSEPVSHWVRAHLTLVHVSDMTLLLMVIGVFMVCFQFFNMFIASVYYYLFNDVVPHAFLARFMALFRMVGGGAGALYNYYILKYANTHMQEIFLGAGLLYFLAFVVMCWKVKEGKYPPPPPNVGGRRGFVPALKSYATECFTHRLYWLLFLANTFAAMNLAATAAYGLVAGTQYLGFNLEFLGKLAGICGVIGIVLLYPAGMIADRFHPLRVLLVASIIQLLMTPLGLGFVFMRHYFSLGTAQWIQIILSVIGIPVTTLYAAAELPTLMKILPQDRYGQFCSANAMIRSFGLIGAGFACGYFLDSMKVFSPVPNDCYRFVSVWNVLFQVCSTFFLFLLHREWKRLGGMRGYQPPRPELPDDAVVALEQ